MSTMSEFEAEMNRLSELDMAVRNYLSTLYAYEQGAESERGSVDYWIQRLDELTSGEMFVTEVQA